MRLLGLFNLLQTNKRPDCFLEDARLQGSSSSLVVLVVCWWTMWMMYPVQVHRERLPGRDPAGGDGTVR